MNKSRIPNLWLRMVTNGYELVTKGRNNFFKNLWTLECQGNAPSFGYRPHMNCA